MSWGPSSVFARALVAAAFLLTAAEAAAEILVVRSAGPSARSYPAGKRLPESARLVLKAGDQLTVLDNRGTRVIRGPGAFTAGAVAVGRTASAAPAADRRARIGAVRGLETGAPRPPSLWHVDVAKSSTVCVFEPARINLWRADPAKALSLDIGGPGGRSRRLAWPAGSTILAWPADLPVADGADYRLSWSGSAKPTAIRFRRLETKPNGIDDLAQILIRNQCSAQLDLLIDTMKLPG